MTQIFVLDDDVVVLRAVEAALSGLGEVTASTLWSEISGEVIRCGRQRGAQTLLVSDLSMPGIAGADFCRIVRAYSPEAKIVIFTGNGGGVSVDAANALVSKSAGIEELVRVVTGLLGPN